MASRRKRLSGKKQAVYESLDRQQQTCRVCGCTNDDCVQCILKTGSACHWVEEDLCSACLEVPPEFIERHLSQIEKLNAEALERLQTFNSSFKEAFP